MKEYIRKAGYKMINQIEGIYKTLEEIAKRDFVLFDTSSLSNPLKVSQSIDSASINEKIIMFEENFQFFCLMKEYLEKGTHFYITQLVFNEIQAGGYSLKKNIKKHHLRGNIEKNRALLDFRRKLREKCKENRSLANLFQDYERVVKLNSNEQQIYDFFYNKYLILKYNYDLSETDFNFLISGISLAKTGKYVTFVSNDFDIFKARRRIVKSEDMLYKTTRFFIRKSFLDFEMMG